MKKALSISLSFFILISLLNITVATHYCRGEFSDVKISLSGKKASCGMESTSDEKSDVLQFSSLCCEDISKIYSVDKEYAPSVFQDKDLIQSLNIVFTIPYNFLLKFSDISEDLHANVSPPDIKIASLVDLADICILRL